MRALARYATIVRVEIILTIRGVHFWNESEQMRKQGKPAANEKHRKGGEGRGGEKKKKKKTVLVFLLKQYADSGLVLMMTDSE